METTPVYQFRVKGHLTDHWKDWFEGLAIHNETNGEATLTGKIDDQASLFGVLSKIQALNLPLLAVNRLPSGAADDLPPAGTDGV